MGDKTLPLVVTLAIIVLLFALIGAGWRNRLRRQRHVAPLPPVPAETGPALATVGGQYVVTTTTGDWLDRIAVHGLGIRTNATLRVFPDGVVLDRSGAQSLYIGRDRLVDVSTTSGMAGKFVEKDGLVVLSWRLGELAVDTGFRTRSAADRAPLVTALNTLLAPGAGPDLPDAGSNGKSNEA